MPCDEPKRRIPLRLREGAIRLFEPRLSRRLGQALYDFSAHAAARALRVRPDNRVFLVGGSVTACVPGSSDVDLLMTYSGETLSIRAIHDLRQRYERVRRWMPWIGGLSVCDEATLRLLMKTAPPSLPRFAKARALSKHGVMPRVVGEMRSSSRLAAGLPIFQTTQQALRAARDGKAARFREMSFRRDISKTLRLTGSTSGNAVGYRAGEHAALLAEAHAGLHDLAQSAVKEGAPRRYELHPYHDDSPELARIVASQIASEIARRSRVPISTGALPTVLLVGDEEESSLPRQALHRLYETWLDLAMRPRIPFFPVLVPRAAYSVFLGEGWHDRTHFVTQGSFSRVSIHERAVNHLFESTGNMLQRLPDTAVRLKEMCRESFRLATSEQSGTDDELAASANARLPLTVSLFHQVRHTDDSVDFLEPARYQAILRSVTELREFLTTAAAAP